MNDKQINLRPLKRDDVSGMLEWMHDPSVNCFFRFDAKNMTESKALAFVEQSLKEMDEQKSFNFAIVNEKDEYLGTISLKDIDWEAKVAEYAISMRSAVQGKGIATIATQRILEVAFEQLKLNRVFLNVLSENEKAIHLYEKCGFIYEGEFRKHLLLREKLKDLKWYSMLKEEYFWKYGAENYS